jgi:hypothetical protein
VHHSQPLPIKRHGFVPIDYCRIGSRTPPAYLRIEHLIRDLLLTPVNETIIADLYFAMALIHSQSVVVYFDSTHGALIRKFKYLNIFSPPGLRILTPLYLRVILNNY